MNKSVIVAVARLQGRVRRTTNVDREAVMLEALDILLSRPHQADTPNKLIDRALAQARRRRRRRALSLARNFSRLNWLSRDVGMSQLALPGRKRVSTADQRLLRLADSGLSTEELSRELGVSPTCARSRLRRARLRVAEAYAA